MTHRHTFRIDRRAIALFVVAMTLGLAAEAHAAVIRYTFVNFTFEDGGTATGFLDWDTSLPDIVSQFSGASVNYDITVAGGDTLDFPAFNYTDEAAGPIVSPGDVGINPLLVIGDVNSGLARQIAILPNGAALGVDLNIPLLISNANTGEKRQLGDPIGERQQETGALVGEVIPEPASATLLAIGGVALLRRRRRA